MALWLEPVPCVFNCSFPILSLQPAGSRLRGGRKVAVNTKPGG